MPSRGPVSQTKPTLLFAGGVPPAPAWLDASARAEYERVVELLGEIPGHLQQVDLSTVCAYSQAYADVCRLTLEIRGDPADPEKQPEGETLTSDKGNAYMNPKVGVLSTAYTRMKDAASRLGFSPSDRARVNAKGPLTKTGKANPLDQFIGT